MVMTASTMMDLGTKAPDFKLQNTDGGTTQLADFEDAKALVVLFICNHCPYVIHIAPKLAEVARAYQQKGIAFVAINSNDTKAYPADSFDKMSAEKSTRGYVFPYCFDETQEVAKAFDAVCTPDLFVFDQSQKLVYRGQFDATRPHRISSGNYDSSAAPASGDDLIQALDAILEGSAVCQNQVASIGCNIKWKPGNEPS